MSAFTAAKIVAKNPASIAMAFGGVFIGIGRPQGWVLILIGAALNLYWIAEN